MRCTVLGDGPTDDVLLDVLRWTLGQHTQEAPELWFHSDTNVERRIEQGRVLFPSDLYVIHRDAEGEESARRRQEIERAIARLQVGDCWVPVVPIRMTEAWFLIDEPALREAAGNPNGREPLQWPAVRRLESLPDPKATLIALLKAASGLRGRRLHSFHARSAVRRLASLIQDYSPLRGLSAFSAFEHDLAQALRTRLALDGPA